MANGSLDPAEIRRRAAFAIMCSRFGLDCRNNPPKPNDKVPLNLSTDLARSVERQILNTVAAGFLQRNPRLPLVWNPTSHLDLFKDLTFQKYAALCWLQLEVRSLARDIEEAVRATSFSDLRTAEAREISGLEGAPQEDVVERAFELLISAARVGEFPRLEEEE